MASLAHCIQKAAKLLSPIEGKKLMDSAAQYRREGFDAQTANESAVQDVITDLNDDLKDIVKQADEVKAAENPYRGKSGTLYPPSRSSSSVDPSLAFFEDKLKDIVNNQELADRLYALIRDSKGGKVIGTDIARELLEEFAESREGKILYTNATGRYGAAYAKDLLWRNIENRNGREALMFTAGGVAAGKSTAVKDAVVAAQDLVFDGTLRESKWAIETIERAIELGWKVDINYVQRPIDLVIQGAIKRAQVGGRWGSLAQLPQIHQDAQKSIIEIAKHFSGNPSVKVTLWLNHGETIDIPPDKMQLAQVDEGGEYSYGNKYESNIHRRGDQTERGIVSRQFWEAGQESLRRRFTEAVRGGEVTEDVLKLLAAGSAELEGILLEAGIEPAKVTLSASKRVSDDQLNLFDLLEPQEVKQVKSKAVRKDNPPTQNGQSDNGRSAGVSGEYGQNGNRETGEQPGDVGSAYPDKVSLQGLGQDGLGYAGGDGSREQGGRRSGQSGGNDSQTDQAASPGMGNSEGSGDENDRGQLSGKIPRAVGGRGRSGAGRRERVRPEAGSTERNHQIEAGDVLALRGDVSKLKANVEAIRLLRTLETENRNATPAEKKVLAQYVGWGGLSQALDTARMDSFNRNEHVTRRRTADQYSSYGMQYAEMVADYRKQAQALENWHDKWGKWHTELKDLLTPEEFAAAAASTTNAHYTSKDVINPMWSMVRRLGFTGGTVLESAMGVGHFFGLQPADLADKSKLLGVELDSISGRISRKLYPEADIQVTGFQDANIPDNSVDLSISNVPFANVSIYDPTMEAAKAPKLSLHNYFFAKALQKARPGGLIAFITTSNTLDSNVKQRQFLASRGELVAAIRLPNTAFNENANTEVTTDIIFMRKPDGSAFKGESFGGLATVKTRNGEDIQVNEYFARHPEMILGQLDNDGKMYGAPDAKGQMTVHPFENESLTESLAKAEEQLPRNIFEAGTAIGAPSVKDVSKMKLGAIAKADDGSIVVVGSSDVDEPILKPENKALARDFMRVRDALNELYRLELDEASTDEAVDEQRAELNRSYDRFVSLHKAAHNHSKTLGVDPDFYRLLGAEVEKPMVVKKGDSVKDTLKRKKEYAKGDVFTKRVLTPRTEPTSANSVQDAMAISLGWRGRLDVDYMAGLVGSDRDAVSKELLDSGIAFMNPESGLLETREQYLSGNVRKKLAVAIAGGESFTRNVDELTAVQPDDISIKDIQFKLGSSWMPARIVEVFAQRVLGSQGVGIVYHPGVGSEVGDSWEVRYNGKGSGQSLSLTPEMSQTYGTARMSGLELLEKSLNMKQPEIYDTDGKTRVFNPTATTQAKEAMQKIKDAFKEWVPTSDYTEEVARVYNETNNSHVLRNYDGQFMQFPWLANGFELYSEKKNVVWRAIQDGRMLIAHGVGGGKTIIGTAIAMELKRLGHAKKPLIVVHNATLEQFASTINQMAPTARVLVARKGDLKDGKRKEFMAKIAAGNWDAVVMAHSTFDRIQDDPAYVKKLSDEMMDQLTDAIQEKGGDVNGDFRKTKDISVKELQKQLARMKEKMKKLQDRKVDDVLNFQQLGVDALILDEAHLYKKLPIVTKLTRIAGIDTGASERGTGLLTKVRYLQEMNKGRNVFTMTGTPVTNTLGESWNMVRLVAPELLTGFGVTGFDKFVSTFAEVETSAELRANGTYKAVDRLAKVSNLPEWNKFFRLAADVKMGGDMQVKGRPEIKGGKPELVAVEKTEQVSKFTDFIRTVIDRYDKLSGKEKRELSHLPLVTYTAAKMAAIDIRLVNAEASDEPNSKVNIALKKVKELYERSSSYNGTQVIFADSYRTINSTALDMSQAGLDRDETADDQDDDADDGRFNLYEDMKKKLMASGIPENEIAIITKFKDDVAKDALFSRVNDGKVRIIIGSTQKLGTGVNMQRRMLAAHHLDVPWTPAELEQRDGRVYRQGNIHSEMGIPVEIYRYGMKDTLDAALWQKLETKERFIKQAVSGKINARSIEDDGALMSLAEQKAVLSGALGMRKFNADQKVKELEDSQRAWRQSQSDAQYAAGKAGRDRGYTEDKLAELETLAAVTDSWPEEPTASLAGQKAKGAEDITKMLKEVFDVRTAKVVADGKPTPGTRAPLGTLVWNGTPIELGPVEITENLGESDPAKKWRLTVPLLLNGKSVGSAISGGRVTRQLLELKDGLPAKLTGARNALQRAADIERVSNDTMSKPFARGEELEAAYKEQQEVMSLLSGKKETEEVKIEAGEYSNATITGPGMVPLGASIRAHHGTPHKVDKFSLDKIGTGEGGQAYGWGLYFAENREVAEEYRKNLSQDAPDIIYDGKPIKTVQDNSGNPLPVLNRVIRRVAHSGKPRAIDQLKRLLPHVKSAQDRAELLEEISALDGIEEDKIQWVPEHKKGNTYTVTLDVEQDELLDWDKPLSEQSEKVREALVEDKVSSATPKSTGADVYFRTASRWGDMNGMHSQGLAAAASEYLSTLGIKGIRYLDEGSRKGSAESYWVEQDKHGTWWAKNSSGEAVHGKTKKVVEDYISMQRRGTYNYVIFDESKIKITKENDTALSAGARVDPAQTAFDFDSPAEVAKDTEKTRQELVTDNMGLAAKLAAKYYNIPGVDDADILQQARKGLVKAAMPGGWDAGRGVKFSTYAWRAIENELRSMYGEQQSVAKHETESLDAPLPNEEASRMEYTPDTTVDVGQEVDERDSAELLRSLVDKLPEKPRAIVLGYMEGLSGEEIGEKLGVSRQYVNIALKNSLAILKKKLGELGLKKQDAGVLYAGKRARKPDEPRASWAEVKAGDRWDYVKKLLPKTSGYAPKLKIGNDVAEDVKKELLREPLVMAADGRWILVANPEGNGPDPILERAKHVSGVRKYGIGSQTRDEMVEKAEIAGAISQTLAGAQVKVFQAEEILYFRRYSNGLLHMVITDKSGGMSDYGTYDLGLLTQYAPKPDRRFEGAFIIEKLNGHAPALSSQQAEELSEGSILKGPNSTDQSQKTDSPLVQDDNTNGETTGQPISAGKRTDSDEDADAFAELMELLNADIPSQTEVDALRELAHGEENGKRTVGVPAKANYAKDDKTRVEINVVQQMREDEREAETMDGWIEEAKARLKADTGKVKAELLQKALNPDAHGTFSPVDVKAAQLLVPQLMRKAFKTGDKEAQREAFALAWAYDAGGTEQARAFAARRDPFKTPAERHVEFLTKIASAPSSSQRKEIAKETNPQKKKQMLEAAQNERLEKIEKALAEMGVTLDDIFSGEAAVSLKSATFVQNALGEFTEAAEREVLRLTLDGFSDNQIAKTTKLTPEQVRSIQDRMDEILAKRLEVYADRGFTADDLEKLDPTALLSAARGDIKQVALTPEEKKAVIANMLKKIRPERAERNAAKMVKRKRKKKSLFGPVIDDFGVEPVFGDAGDSPRKQDVLVYGTKALTPEEQAEINRVRKPSGNAVPAERLKQETLKYEQEQPYEFVRFNPDDKHQVARVAQVMASADSDGFDMVYEAWINGILSGPKTHIVNIMGNAANTLWEYAVQRPMEGLISKLSGAKDATQLGELTHIYKAMIPSISKAWTDALKTWGPEQDFLKQDLLNQQIEFKLNDDKHNRRISIPGKTGRVVRISSRALLFADTFFKSLVARSEVAGQAYRIGKAQGFEGDELEDFMRGEINMPGTMSWHRAYKKAEEMTFQQELPSLIKKVSEMRNLKSGTIMERSGQLILGFFLPFVKTVYNIFRTGIRKSPIGVFNLGFRTIFNRNIFLKEAEYTTAERIKDASEQLLAWGGMALIYGMIEGDGGDDDDKWLLITGSRSFTDYGQKDAFNRMYGGDYMIRIGGRDGWSFNYGRMEPFATILGTTANIVRQKKQEGVKVAAMNIFGMLFQQAKDKTFLSGLSSAADMLDNIGDAKKMGKTWQKALLGTLVPNLFKQPVREWDDVIRDTGNADAIYTLFPFPSAAQERYDLYGNPMVKEGNSLMRLVFPVGMQTSDKMQLGDRMLTNWGKKNAGTDYWPKRYTGYKVGDVAMDAREIALFDKLSGRMFEQKLKNWLTPATASNPTEADIERLKEDLEDARKETKDSMSAAILRRAQTVAK